MSSVCGTRAPQQILGMLNKFDLELCMDVLPDPVNNRVIAEALVRGNDHRPFKYAMQLSKIVLSKTESSMSIANLKFQAQTLRFVRISEDAHVRRLAWLRHIHVYVLD